MTYNQRFTLLREDPAWHVDPDVLRGLLASGYTILSRVWGRMGIIVEVDKYSNLVTLKTTPKARLRYCTVFHVGDPTELQFLSDKVVLITHPDWVLNGLFRGDEEIVEQKEFPS